MEGRHEFSEDGYENTVISAGGWGADTDVERQRPRSLKPLSYDPDVRQKYLGRRDCDGRPKTHCRISDGLERDADSAQYKRKVVRTEITDTTRVAVQEYFLQGFCWQSGSTRRWRG